MVVMGGGGFLKGEVPLYAERQHCTLLTAPYTRVRSVHETAHRRMSRPLLLAEIPLGASPLQVNTYRDSSHIKPTHPPRITIGP